MSYDIGPKIGIEGEKEFRSSINDINTGLKTLGTEMQAVCSEFDKNDKSEQALAAQNEVLNKQIDLQSEKLEKLKQGLASASEKYGENDKVTQGWQQAVNKAPAELNNMSHHLSDNEKAMNDTGEATEDAGKKAKQSGEDAEKGAGGWDKLKGGIGKACDIAKKAAIALGTAALGAATAVGGMTVKAAYAADDLNTLSKQTGISTEDLQKFQFASEQIDVSMDTLTGSMSKLTKNMESARNGSKNQAEAFKALGIEIIGVDGELRNNKDVFNEAIDALGKMENETQRDALAMQIFGKSAQDLNPLILGGADALEELGKQAENAGVILSQDALDNLNLLSDSIDTFKATANGSGNLFSTAFAGPIADAVNTATGYLTQLTTAFNEGGFTGLADAAGTVIADLINEINSCLPNILEFGINIVTNIVDGIEQNFPALVDGALQISELLLTSLLDMMPQILDMGIIMIISLANGLAKSIPDLIPVIIEAVMTIVNTILDNLDQFIDAAINIIMALSMGLIDALPQLIEQIPVIIVKLIMAITDNLPRIIECGMQLLIALNSGILSAIPQLVKSLPQIITAIVNGLAASIKSFVDVGKNIVSGVWEGIKSMGTWIKDKVKNFFSGIVDGVKGILGIHSPSRVARDEIGKMFGAGLVLGIEDTYKDVEKAMTGLNNKLHTNGQININSALNNNLNGLGNQNVYVNVPVELDGNIITSTTSVVQYGYNVQKSRALGVVV